LIACRARQRQGRLPQPQLDELSSTTRCACPRSPSEEAHISQRAHELIAFMDLVPFTNAIAGGLPSDPQAGRIARALASSPKLLLLDEPGRPA